jgi:hypothetical protein
VWVVAAPRSSAAARNIDATAPSISTCVVPTFLDPRPPASVDDGGIIIAKGARALFRMTGRMTGRTILNDWGLASHCMHAGSPRLHGGACWPSKVRQGGLHEEAAHHKAGESNRTCAHRVQLPKQNPVQAHKRAQQRRGWRAVDRRAGGCAQNSVHVCSLVTRHRGRA